MNSPLLAAYPYESNPLKILRRLRRGNLLIEIDDKLGSQAATLAIDLRLRGADAVYVAVAQYFNLPLITWDAEIIIVPKI